MDTEYRLARDEDLPAMRMVQGLALRDLAARMGTDAASMPLDDQPTPPMRYLRRTAPALSWVAVHEGRVMGFSQGFVRGDLWFLSNLFVHPELQKGGTGAALLRRCLEAGTRRGAAVRAVCSSPELAAQALYARHGMIPRFPLFALQGRAQALRALPAPRMRVVQAASTNFWLGRIGPLDQFVWGRRRDADHRFAHRELNVGCLANLGDDGSVAGYVYHHAGQLGPLCARTPRMQLELLHAAGAALAQSDKNIRIWVPGINGAALVALLEAGFRILFSNLLMASRRFGRFDRYLPSGGTLL